MSKVRGPMIAPAAGRFLVAAPGLNDPNFHRSVVLLCRYEREVGSLGLILNRRLPVTIGMAAPDLGTEREEPLWSGGPVEPRGLWILHARGDLREPGESIGPALFFGCESDLVHRVLRTSGPDKESRILRLFAGYSGWSAGQLEDEIEEGAWAVLPGGPATVFVGGPEDLWTEMWSKTLLRLGRDGDLFRRSGMN